MHNALLDNDFPIVRRVHFPRISYQNLCPPFDYAEDFIVVIVPVSARVEFTSRRHDGFGDAVVVGRRGIDDGYVLLGFYSVGGVVEENGARVWCRGCFG